MAWRIHDSVIRGEIDNRIKGQVCGTIWLHGCAQPVILELRGNAHRDLAGCLLTFANPRPLVPLRDPYVAGASLLNNLPAIGPMMSNRD